MPSAIEFRAMSDGELLDQVEEYKEELFNLRFQLASGQLENVSRIKVVRKNLARAKTILRERQLATDLLKEEENA